MEARVDAAEKYERGVALRKTGLFKQAIQEFEQAAEDRTYALKALCHKSLGRHEEAVVSFRNALKSPQSSRKETVQILYVLGRSLEMLGRTGETLEVYRWIRREDPAYRDVELRIQQLSVRRTSIRSRPSASWVGAILRSWQVLLGLPK
jgi:tetratricopeptide (TPR) repeat protein